MNAVWHFHSTQMRLRSMTLTSKHVENARSRPQQIISTSFFGVAQDSAFCQGIPALVMGLKGQTVHGASAVPPHHCVCIRCNDPNMMCAHDVGGIRGFNRHCKSSQTSARTPASNWQCCRKESFLQGHALSLRLGTCKAGAHHRGTRYPTCKFSQKCGGFLGTVAVLQQLLSTASDFPLLAVSGQANWRHCALCASLTHLSFRSQRCMYVCFHTHLWERDVEVHARRVAVSREGMRRSSPWSRCTPGVRPP